MTFTLPDHVANNAQTLRAIADRHGFDGAGVERLPETGIFNTIFRLGGGATLRTPRHHSDSIAARSEAVAVPAARAGGSHA